MKKLAGVLAVGMLMMFSGLLLECRQDESIVEGIVTGRRWIPEWTETQFMWLPDGNGGLTPFPHFVTHEDEWWIEIGHHWYEVSKSAFDTTSISKFWTNRKPEHLTNE